MFRAAVSDRADVSRPRCIGIFTLLVVLAPRYSNLYNFLQYVVVYAQVC